MSDSTRRGFLKVTGAGVAAAGVAAVVPAIASQGATEDVAVPASASREMLVHVKNVHTGELSMMVDGREVAVTDRHLAARLAHAMHSAPSQSV